MDNKDQRTSILKDSASPSKHQYEQSSIDVQKRLKGNIQTSSSFYQNYSPSQRSVFPPSSIYNERGAAAATDDDEATYRKPAAASRRNPRKI